MSREEFKEATGFYPTPNMLLLANEMQDVAVRMCLEESVDFTILALEGIVIGLRPMSTGGMN
jgi:hypothetical protein